MSPARTFPENSSKTQSKKSKKSANKSSNKTAEVEPAFEDSDLRNEEEDHEEYVWTLSKELEEFARKELGETEEVRTFNAPLNCGRLETLIKLNHIYVQRAWLIWSTCED